MWFAAGATASFDVALFWMKQWSKFASFDAIPATSFMRYWPQTAERTPAPPADTPADIAFGPATDALPDVEAPPVDAAKVLGLEAAPPEPEPVPDIAEPVAEATLAVADELTRIVGIGPRLAAGLAKEGVTAFSQIAAWTADDLARFDKALDLKGRAVRDAWVAQAWRFAESAGT
jgi:predicted flap endonuclease-1-like 5' DNA nuclease